MSRFPHYDAIGAIVGVLVVGHHERANPDRVTLLHALDGVADLLTDHCRTRRAHQREMLEEQRAMQRDTRDAIAEAVYHERERRDDW